MAETLDFTNGPLTLHFDGATGALLSIAHQGRPLAEASSRAWPTSFSVGEWGQVKWGEAMGLPRQLVAQAQLSPDVLELTVTAGDYEIVERYRLFADRPRLDRSARLTYRGADAQKLRGFRFLTPGVRADGDGFYRFPGAWPPTSYRVADMVAGQHRRGPWGSFDPLLAETAPERTIFWVSYADDIPHAWVDEGEGRFDVRQEQECMGWLRPGEPQDIGFVTMEIVDAGYWGALPKLWEWMDSVGMVVPPDRPAWIKDARLYAFHPGGTHGSNFRDLGGFVPSTELLLPSLTRLNVNTIWVLPVEKGGVYSPWDYYDFMEGLGTAEQYRGLVKRAHDLGIHVLQDSVPHGGRQDAPHNIAHPEWLVYDEDGQPTRGCPTCDYGNADWQRFMAEVSGYWVRQYDIDGFRVDTAWGSGYNWKPDVPYQRASLAGMSGGIAMLHAVRDAVKEAKPEEGAVLAEVDSPRHLVAADWDYDMEFGVAVCHSLRRMPADQFVAAAQEWFEESKYIRPRDAWRLRTIENHDMLRSQWWYGVEGMRALYALSAWVDGMPILYQEQDRGHGFAIREIHDARTARPELARGEAFYRAVECSAPGVFTCLRTLDDRESVIAINFAREPVTAALRWPGGSATVSLKPMKYTVVPGDGSAMEDASICVESPAAVPVTEDVLEFEGGGEWFIDTVEGRLHDGFWPLRGRGQPGHHRRLYWRPQGTDDLWLNEMQPLHPSEGRVGVRNADGLWRIVRFEEPTTVPVRLVERLEGKTGLYLVGLKGAKAFASSVSDIPPEPDVTAGTQIGGVRLRVVGPDYIVENDHYTVALRRQGGVVRELWHDGRLVARDHDIHAEGEDFQIRGTWSRDWRINAACDVESGIRIEKTADDRLHLTFEGQVRGFQNANRFGVRSPALWYRNEYVFDERPAFAQRWAFCSDEDLAGQNGMVAASVAAPGAVRFRAQREGVIVGEGGLGAEAGDVRFRTLPSRLDLLAEDGSGLSLSELRIPSGSTAHVLVRNDEAIVALAEGRDVRMVKGRWYEFSAKWGVL